MLIDGIALAGYRSIGSGLQKLGPLSKVNLLIGPNNSGKSNFLLFLATHYRNAVLSARGHSDALKLNHLDIHLGLPSAGITVGFAIARGSLTYQNTLQRLKANLDARTTELLKQLIFAPPIAESGNVAWFLYQGSVGSQLGPHNDFVNKVITQHSQHREPWSLIWQRLTNQGRGSYEHHWVPETLRAIAPIHQDPPHIALIPAVRRIGDPGTSPAKDFSGTGIIDRLAQLQNPPHDQQTGKDRFNQINGFLREVTGIPSATLEIPYARDMVLVHAEGRTLPLLHMGTGIHEVVILAAAATVLSESILCVEEPELHLHPTLQKKLLSYLKDNTTNQYIVSTHSASLLDSPDVSIFRVRQDIGISSIAAVSTPSDIFAVAQDLGYRASDLLQTNSIVWVEGPSDRIYMNYWIHSVDPSLIEGVHYSIMFYGGRLLRHLSANDPDIDDFISLRRLNRNVAIVIDSDKSSSKAPLNPTKQRLVDELTDGLGLAWITAGREIENYVPRALLEAAARAAHPSVDHLHQGTRYSDPLRCVTSEGTLLADVDKVRVARNVASGPFDWDVLDLRAQLARVINLIRQANGLVISS